MRLKIASYSVSAIKTLYRPATSLALAALAFIPGAAGAVGHLISAPQRVDMVYDDARELLYITSTNQVLRYSLASRTFLQPFNLGGTLRGIDISDGGTTLAVADASVAAGLAGIHIVDLETSQSYKANYTLESSYAEGPPSVAFAGDGSVLIATGAQWGNLHRYVPATKTMQTIPGSMRHRSMLVASADGSVVGFAEGDTSDGRFGRYRTADGDVLRRQWYDFGTGWFNFEVGVNFDGTQYAIPTYGGTFFYNKDLIKTATIGTYAGPQPIGVAYSPVEDIAYFPWADTTKIFVYNTETLTKIKEYDFEHLFDHTGNHAYRQGRVKTSLDGRLLFCTVNGGVRYFLISEAPVPAPQQLATDEDTAVSVTLTATDDNAQQLSYAVASGPVHGKLTGTAPHLTYTPNPNYFGTDAFAFKANDGMQDSLTTAVTITVRSVPDAPVAYSSTASTAENKPVTITLVASDPDGGALGYHVTIQPQHGTLTGTGSRRTYTPSPSFAGMDSFVFKVSDGVLESAEATVQINVLEVNDAPVAIDQSVEVDEDSTLAITLTGSDDEENSLTFAVYDHPSHGYLTGSAQNVTYHPYENYNGPDAFTFKAYDGEKASEAAVVSVNVLPVADAPGAHGQTVTLEEDTLQLITLTGYDVDKDALQFEITSGPANGTVEFMAGATTSSAVLSYRPHSNFNGSDYFTFRTFDGSLHSADATVALEVTGVNDIPEVNTQSITVVQKQSVNISLQALDVEGDTLTYMLSTLPAHGTLSGSLPDLVYTPEKKFTGYDRLEYQVSDGGSPVSGAVEIVVIPRNKSIVAFSQSAATKANTPIALELEGWSVTADPFDFTIVKQPKKGQLSGDIPNLVYTPAPGYSGPDKFKFRITGSNGKSKTATVKIIVGP